MPGIVGFITKAPRQSAGPHLHRMVEAINHESFYSTGTWIEESLGVYVGWAVQKNSFSDGQPLINERQDVVLVFSGEEYPEPGTAGRLISRGHQFDAKGPSYLVHVYEDDPKFPAGLNGRFHGLLIDRRQGKALLFNDRYGMHRLYFHEAQDTFYFAAEAKAILAVRPELRKLDLQGVGEFISCSCPLDNRTMFEGISLVPGGAAWEFRNGPVPRKRSYFDVREWEEQSPLSAEEYYQQLREAFTRNLGRYFNGRQKVGVSLTGGMDTRVIMAWRKAEAGSLPCYTYGGMFRDCRDVQVAREVAGICHQSHSVVEVGKDFLSQFPRYAERSVYLSDGSVHVSRAADLYVSEKVRDIAPVRIAGTYGSEVLTQAPMFKPVDPMPGLFQPELSAGIEQAKATYARLRRRHPVTFAAFLQSPWWHYGVLALEQSQLSVRSPYLDNDFVRVVYRGPKALDMTRDVRWRMISDGNPALARVPSDRGVNGLKGQVTTMPSRRFHEFTFKAEYAYDYGMPQWLAKLDHIFSPLHFERLFLGRHKFAHYRVWYRDGLSNYLREVLLDPRSLARPYVKKKALEAVVDGHLKGNRNYTLELHRLLSLELLHRQFIDVH
ncbi:MAG TPA: asparagine synthase-related protein [Terriglobia bacterium]|nr:asparagine synthase-related protein [Terriglobia bacterium]